MSHVGTSVAIGIAIRRFMRSDCTFSVMLKQASWSETYTSIIEHPNIVMIDRLAVWL